MVLRQEDFTSQAQQAIAESQDLMRSMNHSQWDSEHILLALLEQEQGVPADIFRELGLSIDDTADKIQAFADEYNVNYPMLVGLGREDFQEAYGPVWGIPMTFFIDREGTLCRTHTGIANREEFEKDIADLL